jgi:hypothetical protein
MSRAKKKRDFVGVSVRTSARTRLKAFADRRRMNFADAVDVASTLLEQAPREQVDAVIEGRPAVNSAEPVPA